MCKVVFLVQGKHQMAQFLEEQFWRFAERVTVFPKENRSARFSACPLPDLSVLVVGEYKYMFVNGFLDLALNLSQKRGVSYHHFRIE